jgi:hypothetical protein
MRIHVKSTDYVYGLVTEDDTPPLFLVNPYYLLHSGENHITICNADAGHRYYLGLLGHRTCVAYETEVEFFAGDCELEHSDDISDRHGLVELEVDHLYLQSGKQHAVYDFYFHVDADKTNNNLVFEVQDMSAELRTGALTIKLYSGKIPVDRQSEYYADFASGGLYSLAVNVLDLVEGDYYISVTVNEVDTDFRVLARCILVRVGLDIDEWVSWLLRGSARRSTVGQRYEIYVQLTCGCLLLHQSTAASSLTHTLVLLM